MRTIGLWLLLSGILALGVTASVRWLRQRGDTAKVPDAALGLMSVLATASLVTALSLLVLVTMIEPNPGLPYWIIGIWVGLSLYGIRIAFSLAALLCSWATGRPVQTHSLGLATREIAVESVGFVGISILIVRLVDSVGSWGWAAFVLIPPLLALFPLFDHLVYPTLVFLRFGATGRELHSKGQRMQAWVSAVSEGSGLGTIKVVVAPGRMSNAFAIGFWPFGRWILVGEGLLDGMDDRQVQAVVAHELGHFANRDALRLIGVGLLAGAVFASVIPLTAPLFSSERDFLGLLCIIVASPVLLAFVPGWYSRKVEFQADRFAARIVSDPEDLCSALHRLSQLQGDTADKNSLTHPSVVRRVQAIREAAA